MGEIWSGSLYSFLILEEISTNCTSLDWVVNLLSNCELWAFGLHINILYYFGLLRQQLSDKWYSAVLGSMFAAHANNRFCFTIIKILFRTLNNKILPHSSCLSFIRNVSIFASSKFTILEYSKLQAVRFTLKIMFSNYHVMGFLQQIALCRFWTSFCLPHLIGSMKALLRLSNKFMFHKKNWESFTQPKIALCICNYFSQVTKLLTGSLKATWCKSHNL